MGYSTPAPYAIAMVMVWVARMGTLAAAALLLAGVAVPVSAIAQDRSQSSASRRQAAGQILPAREIERRVVPQERGSQYLGFDFDPETNIYTLKFLRNGSVIWVDVDGRTGRIVRRSGN